MTMVNSGLKGLYRAHAVLYIHQQRSLMSPLVSKYTNSTVKKNMRRRAWHIGRAPGCHTCSQPFVPGSNPADPAWGFQRIILVSPFSMWL